MNMLKILASALGLSLAVGNYNIWVTNNFVINENKNEMGMERNHSHRDLSRSKNGNRNSERMLFVEMRMRTEREPLRSILITLSKIQYFSYSSKSFNQSETGLCAREVSSIEPLRLLGQQKI